MKNRFSTFLQIKSTENFWPVWKVTGVYRSLFVSCHYHIWSFSVIASRLKNLFQLPKKNSIAKILSIKTYYEKFSHNQISVGKRLEPHYKASSESGSSSDFTSQTEIQDDKKSSKKPKKSRMSRSHAEKHEYVLQRVSLWCQWKNLMENSNRKSGLALALGFKIEH